MTAPFEKTSSALLTAMHKAQLIAWGPLLFQAARVLRDRGLLTLLIKRASEGVSIDDLARQTQTSPYGVTVLLEAGMAMGMVEKEGEVFRPTRVAYLMERDPLTRANMNFVADVCYRPAAHLDESIEKGTPAGLSELGDWPTVYEGLSELDPQARRAWLEFDHFYSDDSFPRIIERVFASSPKKVLDVGGNTGKFALQLLSRSPDVHVTVADLPGQIASCKANIEEAGFGNRVRYHAFSILEADAALPEGHDVIWMSQFLCCFSEEEILHILGVAQRALGPEGRLLITDNLWDRQKNEVGELCLQATSLYFTCIANGNSRMYDSKTLLALIEASGLVVAEQMDGIGWGHSLIECRAAQSS